MSARYRDMLEYEIAMVRGDSKSALRTLDASRFDAFGVGTRYLRLGDPRAEAFLAEAAAQPEFVRDMTAALMFVGPDHRDHHWCGEWSIKSDTLPNGDSNSVAELPPAARYRDQLRSIKTSSELASNVRSGHAPVLHRLVLTDRSRGCSRTGCRADIRTSPSISVQQPSR